MRTRIALVLALAATLVVTLAVDRFAPPATAGQQVTVRVVITPSACRVAPKAVTVGDVRFDVSNRSRAGRWFAIAGRKTPTLRANGRAVITVSLLKPGRVSYLCGAPGRPALVRRGDIQVRAAVRSVVIDTDMSVDDWMAILFLLHRPDVSVKAITVSGTGVAHGEPGARNAIRLLDLDGRSGIPVAYGRATPYPGGHAFPDGWRPALDSMLGLLLPQPSRSISSLTAVDLLLKTAQSGSIDLLSLGPPTNIADALKQSSSFASHVGSVTLMSGALDVPGNAGAGNADWNFYVDPAAADIVLRSGIPATLVPLDATNAVPYNTAFYKRLAGNRRTPAARFVYDALSRQMPGNGLYFWDPFAAAVLVDASVAMFQTRTISVVASGADAGRTISDPGGTSLRAAVRGDPGRFEEIFLEALNRQSGP